MRIAVIAIMTCMIAATALWQQESTLFFFSENAAEKIISHTLPPSESMTAVVKSAPVTATAHIAQHTMEEQGLDDIDSYPDQTQNDIDFMRNAYESGDPRAPMIAPKHERDMPSEDELLDHDKYIEYEQRQQKRVYRAFIEASKIKVAKILDMIEQGKAQGVSEEEIAFAEKKIAGIEEMARELEQNFPDAMDDDYQPPSDWLLDEALQESQEEATLVAKDL